MSKRKIRNMEEFAAQSGVSRPTVSKYFNDPKSVRKSTRNRIEEALERYDYRPNVYAINQNRRLTKNIGIVVPFVADPFFAEIARNIEQRCIAAGYSPTTFSSHGSVEHEIEILDTLRSIRPAGVLMAPLGRASNRQSIEKFCEDVPTVLFDSNIEGVGEAFVGSDNAQFVKLSVDYLCRTGEPPTFFEMDPVNPNANKRRNAYIESMTKMGFDPHVIRVEGTGWGFEEIGYKGGLDLIAKKGGLPTKTVLCSNDRLAIGFLAACYEEGVNVGHKPGCDLRVAGHDNHPVSRFTCPSLTTVSQDYEKISETGLETLLSVSGENRTSEPRQEVLFEGKLVMRASA